MAQPNRDAGRVGPPLDRRRLLGLGAIGLTATALSGLVAACTVPSPTSTGPSGPTASGRTSAGAQPTSTPAPSSTSTPTPSIAGGAEGAALERRLAASAAGVEARWRTDLDERRTVLTGLVAAHQTHAEALLSPTPTSRPTTDPAPTTTAHRPAKGDDLAEALAALAASESATATAHRTRALTATGFDALVWASLGVAATSYAAAITTLADGLDEDKVADLPRFAKATERRPLPELAPTEAVATLVRQLHACVYGYQLAIGQLSSGAAKDRAVSRLRAHRALRDALIRQLIAAKAEVPVADPAYVPSVRPRNPATAAKLIMTMERTLAPFVGIWLASAPKPADRSSAYDALLATDAAARAFGARLLVWPGWNG